MVKVLFFSCGFTWTRCLKSKYFFVRRLCKQMQRFKLNRQWYWTTSWLIWNDSFERDCPQCKIWCHFGSTKFNGTSFCFLWSLRVHLHCNNILKEFFFKQYRYRFLGIKQVTRWRAKFILCIILKFKKKRLLTSTAAICTQIIFLIEFIFIFSMFKVC
jgi:hypothetical protein